MATEDKSIEVTGRAPSLAVAKVPKQVMTPEQAKEYFASMALQQRVSTLVRREIKPTMGCKRVVVLIGRAQTIKATLTPQRGTAGNKTPGRSVFFSLGNLAGSPFSKITDEFSAVFLPIVPTMNSAVTVDSENRWQKNAALTATPSTETPISRVDGKPIRFMARGTHSMNMLGPVPNVGVGSPAQAIGVIAKLSQIVCPSDRISISEQIIQMNAAGFQPVSDALPPHETLEDLIEHYVATRYFGVNVLTTDMIHCYQHEMGPQERLWFEHEHPEVAHNNGKAVRNLIFGTTFVYNEIRPLVANEGMHKAANDFQASVIANRDVYDRELLQLWSIRQEIRRTKKIISFPPIHINAISSPAAEAQAIETKRMMEGINEAEEMMYNSILDAAERSGSTTAAPPIEPIAVVTKDIAPVLHFEYLAGPHLSNCFSKKNGKGVQLTIAATASMNIPETGLTHLEALQQNKLYTITINIMVYEEAIKRSALAYSIVSTDKAQQAREIDAHERIYMHMAGNVQNVFSGRIESNATFANPAANVIDMIAGSPVPFSMIVDDFYPDVWTYLQKFGVPVTSETVSMLIGKNMPNQRDALVANAKRVGAVTNLSVDPNSFHDCLAVPNIKFFILVVPPRGPQNKPFHPDFTEQTMKQIVPETGSLIFRPEWSALEVPISGPICNPQTREITTVTFGVDHPLRVLTAQFGTGIYHVFACSPTQDGNPADAIVVSNILKNGACYMPNGMILLGADSSMMPKVPSTLLLTNAPHADSTKVPTAAAAAAAIVPDDDVVMEPAAPPSGFPIPTDDEDGPLDGDIITPIPPTPAPSVAPKVIIPPHPGKPAPTPSRVNEASRPPQVTDVPAFKKRK